MRPSLPLLPIPTMTYLSPSSPSSSASTSPASSTSSLTLPSSPTSPRRPPVLPPRSAPTWRSVLVRNTAPRLNADVVGVALLAAEAKRRGGLMMRERRYVGAQGRRATSLSRQRVDLLEQDVRALLRTVAKAKARVKHQLKQRQMQQQFGVSPTHASISKR